MCKSTAGSRLSNEKLIAMITLAVVPPWRPTPSATNDPIFHKNASAAASMGSLVRLSRSYRQFKQKKDRAASRTGPRPRSVRWCLPGPVGGY